MAARFDAERQDGCPRPLDLAAPGTPPRSRGCATALEPFGNATRKGPSLCLRPGQLPVELGDGGTLVGERLPVLTGPADRLRDLVRGCCFARPVFPRLGVATAKPAKVAKARVCRGRRFSGFSNFSSLTRAFCFLAKAARVELPKCAHADGLTMRHTSCRRTPLTIPPLSTRISQPCSSRIAIAS